MTLEMEAGSTLERLLALTDVCMEWTTYNFTIIVQYDPFVNDTTSFVEEDAVINENGGGSPMEDD